MANDDYAEVIQTAEEKLLAFLRTFEAIQENMRVERLDEFQGQLREVAPDGFDGLIAGLGWSTPPDSMLRFHDVFTAAIRHLGNASQTFLGASESSLLSCRPGYAPGVVPGPEPAVWHPRAHADAATILAAARLDG